MLIYPAIDIYDGKAVRLYKGDYEQMTVYSDEPLLIAKYFAECGATHIHLVDLEGARSGGTDNIDIIREIAAETGLSSEVGGGIRSMDVIERYLSAGVGRVILGTAAVTNRGFLSEACAEYDEHIAVGVDIRDGSVAVRGWTEKSGLDAMDFCREIDEMGVRTVICTDISRDGAMRGANIELYRYLMTMFTFDLIASGGVSSMEDLRNLNSLGIHGAIIGKALYTGDINLRKAIAETGK